jgi:dienelactone hydrolase
MHRSIPPRWLVLGADDRPCMVFLPGFFVAPVSYRALLAPVAEAGMRVVVPLLVPRGPRLALGRVSPEQEAERAVELVQRLAGDGPIALAGHSRGGLVAWLAAAARPPARLAVVDPVAGGGPPWRPATRPVGLVPGLAPLIIGCGVGGPCAPTGRNHQVFADSTPDAVHVVVEDAGHADVLDGRFAALGRRVCSSGSDPGAARRRISALLVEHLTDASGAAPS